MSHESRLAELRQAIIDAIAHDDLDTARRLIREVTPKPSLPPLGQDLKVLAQVPILTDLTREELLALVGQLELRNVAAGDRVLTEGEAGRNVFAIAYGRVEVSRGRGDQRHVLAELGPGEFFGEMALVARVPRLASVVAVEPTGLFVLTDEHIARLSREHPHVLQVLSAYYKERLLEDLVALSPLLASLDSVGRRTAVEKFSIGVVPASTPLIEEGRPGGGLYVILRGRCAVEGTATDGAPVDYPDMGEGDVFGEIALVHETPATASVRTAERCVVLALTKREFDDVILANPAARERVLALADSRLARTAELTVPQKQVLSSRVI